MQYFDGFPLRYDTMPSESLADLRLYFRVAFKTQLTFRTVSLAVIKTFCHALVIAPLFQRIFLIFNIFCLRLILSVHLRLERN